MESQGMDRDLLRPPNPDVRLDFEVTITWLMEANNLFSYKYLPRKVCTV